MFKKLLFLLPLVLTVTFASTTFNSESVVNLSANEERGEYNGYTYTANGNERIYDSKELAPTIVKNFWAPAGYKYSLHFSEEQIDAILDQGESVGLDYSYVLFNISYTKFGMKIYYNTLINDFDGRESCKQWTLDVINNAEPFYESRETTVETDISIIFEFYFVVAEYSSEYTNYTFTFIGETMPITPFSEADCIDFSIQYYIQDTKESGDEKRVYISCNPIPGFFKEEPYNNPFGFVTDETMQRYSQEAGGFIEGAKYEFILYAYGTTELKNLGFGGVEITSLPSYPLPCKIKLTFVSGGVQYNYWTKEFYFGDQGFDVTIDGNSDRSAVQKNSSHLYGIEYNDLNNTKNYQFDFRSRVIPYRLEGGANVREYYDRIIKPDDLYDYFLKGSFNNWEKVDDYVFIEESEGHYKLTNVPLYSGDHFRVYTTEEEYKSYINASTWEGCGFVIDEIWEYLTVIETGTYDVEFILNPVDHNHVRITRTGDYVNPSEPEQRIDYYLVGSFNNWAIEESYKLTSDEGDQNHYFMKNKLMTIGDTFMISDANGNLYSTTKDWECCGYDITESGLVMNKTAKVNIDFRTKSSNKYNIVLESSELEEAPLLGEEDYVFYIPSNEEVRLHAQNRDEEFLDQKAAGVYYVWNSEINMYDYYGGEVILDMNVSSENGDTFDKQQLASIGYAGEWTIYLNVSGTTELERIYCSAILQNLTVFAGDDTEDTILLNVPDEVNMLYGGDKLPIVPSISSYNPAIDYYYDWSEPTKESVVDIVEDSDGILMVTPIAPGLTEITVSVECELFSKISKTISIRVLDAIYDVAKIKVPNEFHYAGKDLTASISIRGFTKIQNIDVDWTVTNKSGKEIPQEKLVVNSDASITLLKADSEDYTFVAYYQGVKLDTLTVKVRLTDINKFLKTNVWWIFLLTVALVVFSVLMRKLFKRGKTTVDNIQGVYDVFCKCISDDKLSLPELKIIKKELTKCVHRCEDLNIEALNQYEKAIRYLRKSLGDTNSLINKWDSLTPEDKSAFTEKLNLDLAKALNVAREIENAKDLIEQYHFNANKKNYEVISDEGKTK